MTTIAQWDDCIEQWYRNSMALTGPIAPFSSMKALSSEYLPEPYYGDYQNCLVPVININPGRCCANEDSKNWNYRKDPNGSWDKCSTPGKGQLLYDFEHNHNYKYSEWQKVYSPFVNRFVPGSKDWWEPYRNEYINRVIEVYQAAKNSTDVKPLPEKGPGNNVFHGITPFALELCPLHSKTTSGLNFDFKGLKHTYINNVIEPACESLKHSKIPFGLGFGRKVYDALCASGLFVECKKWQNGLDVKTSKEITGWPQKNRRPINRTYALLKGNYEDAGIGLNDHHPYFLVTWHQGSFIQITHTVMVNFDAVDEYIVRQIAQII